MDENREIEDFLRKFETIEPSGGTERELLKMAQQKTHQRIRARTQTSRFRLVAAAVLLASMVAALYLLIISAAPLGRETEVGRLPEHLSPKRFPVLDVRVKMPTLPQVPTRTVEVIKPQEIFSRETDSLAVVVDIIGEVTTAGKVLKRGDALGKGALVETAAGSMCAIAGRDGSNFKLNTQTAVRFADLTESRLIEIEKGELYADAASAATESTPLIVKTPNSKATALGTEFSLTVTSQRTLLSVREGSVSLESSSGKATVGASEQCLVTLQKPPLVRRLVHLSNRFGWTALLSSEGQHPVEKSRSAATFIASEGSVGTLVARVDDKWQSLTLSRQHITVIIEGGVARTTVEEAFYNNTGSQLEGQFKFPLPKDASICRFAMTVDPEGRKLMEGSIVERTYARQIYESIIARKRDPGLLEWQSGSTFSARIFPIFPRSEKRIVISYTQPVSTHAGFSKYTYPMVGSLMTTMPPEDFKLVVMLKTSGKIISLDCPSHNAGIARDSDTCVRVGFAAENYSARNNFVLSWGEEAGGQDVVQTRGAQGYALLRLRPDLSGFPAETLKRVVLLVDTSASIAPNEREIIYNVVEKILTNLSPDCEFLIGFVDVSTRFAADGFEKATPENIEKALAEVWSADSAGATNLQKCAESLSEALTGGSPATVIYIGDGQPTMGETHLPELTALFKDKLSDKVSRFFAVGVGSNADEMMLRSISSTLRGTHTLLLPGDNLLDKILALREEINQPILTDATLTVEGELLQAVYPAAIPPIPAGGECIVVAKYNKIGKVSATLKGRVADKEYQKIIQFTTGAGNVSETTLGRIWAQRRISDLLSTNTGGRNKEEIIALSKSFSILTPYTSLLVLETEEEYKRYSIDRKPETPEDAKQLSVPFAAETNGGFTFTPKAYRYTSGGSITSPESPHMDFDRIPLDLENTVEQPYIVSGYTGDIGRHEYDEGTEVTATITAPRGHDTPDPLLDQYKDVRTLIRRGTSLESLRDLGIPVEEIVRFPDKEKWLEVINKRMQGIREPAEIQLIIRMLETRPVTLSFQDTPLSQVISFLREITGLNITIDPAINADVTVTLRLRDIILKNVLQLIMDQTGYMYVFNDNAIVITRKLVVIGKDERQTQMTPLQKAWAELLTLSEYDEEPPKESYDKILGDRRLEEIIEKAKKDHNSEEVKLLNKLLRAYPDWNASEEECQKIARQQDEIFKALVTIWSYDVKHSVKSALLAFERLPKNEALLLLGEEVSGTSRLDILMQNLPREVVIIILAALINLREDASAQTAQNEKLLRLKRKVYEALLPEFVQREDFVRTFAVILSASGDKEKAIRLLSSGIDTSPDDHSKRGEFAASLRQAGYFAEACEQYEEAIRLRPEEASYYVAAAECAEATGETGSKRAEELYTTVLKMNLDENNPLAATASQKLLGMYERQLAAFTASGDSKDAANVSEKIKKLKEKKLVCAELRVVLCWDTGSTDVDLWVTPPEDQKCFYQQKRTFRGGKLDKDVTSGYGPETFTMSGLRPGKYLIQVNYYSGGPKTNGTVEIITYEGTEKEKKTTSKFTLRERGEVVTIFDGELK